MRFIGIDPGKHGGVGIIDGSLAIAHKLPDTQKDTFDLFEELSMYGGETYALLEEVNAMPRFDIKTGKAVNIGTTSAFSFGRGIGFIESCMFWCMWSFERVRPAKWQKFMGCMSKGNKNITKEKAQALFPGMKVIHATADALLIAEYARRTYKP